MLTVNIHGIEFPKAKIDEFNQFLNHLDFVELMIVANDRAEKLPNLTLTKMFLKQYNMDIESKTFDPNKVVMLAKSLVEYYFLTNTDEYKNSHFNKKA